MSFSSISFIGKIIGKRIEPWTFGLKGRFKPLYHIFFFENVM
jgi:hypothetical protein